MRISYSITVCTELDEIKRLINAITTYKQSKDEIVIIYDCINGTDEVYDYLKTLNPGTTYNPIEDHPIRWYSFDFDNDFSKLKNWMNEMCAGDWIVNIDADEIPNQYLMENLHSVLEQNQDVDLILVPRINMVSDITKEHLVRWGWKMDENGWINYPDWQLRIYRNTPDIRWENKVHEKIVGYKKFAFLPEIEEFSLYHPKTIQKQEKQNSFYNTI
jgi:hypothetical protein